MFKFTLKILTLTVFVCAFTMVAQAQATRTWVSGVGDDANPCSRTAPCKTFAGAISKTFIGGEIDALDPGGYGTVTITKSITLDGGTGSGWASILASGTNGVNINVPVNANDPNRYVILRHLSINGAGASGAVGTRTGLRGVSYTQAARVMIEDCQIFNFSTAGVFVTLTATGNISIQRTTLDHNQIGYTQTISAGTLNASISDSVIQHSTGNGVEVNAGTVNISDTTASNNGSGFVAQGAVGSVLNVDNSVVVNSTNAGVQAATAQATVRVNNVAARRNGTGLLNSGGVFETCRNNKIRGNTTETSGALTDVSTSCTQ